MTEDFNNQEENLRNSNLAVKVHILWKIYFWVNLVILIYFLPKYLIDGTLSLDLKDKLDLVISIIGVIGLFGFSFSKPIGNYVFWRYIFYLSLIETFIFMFVFTYLGVELYGVKSSFDLSFSFELILAYYILAAIYKYAYKRPDIWHKST